MVTVTQEEEWLGLACVNPAVSAGASPSAEEEPGVREAGDPARFAARTCLHSPYRARSTSGDPGAPSAPMLIGRAAPGDLPRGLAGRWGEVRAGRVSDTDPGSPPTLLCREFQGGCQRQDPEEAL